MKRLWYYLKQMKWGYCGWAFSATMNLLLLKSMSGLALTLMLLVPVFLAVVFVSIAWPVDNHYAKKGERMPFYRP